MFGIPCIAAVFFGRTRGISAIAGGVMFGNSGEKCQLLLLAHQCGRFAGLS